MWNRFILSANGIKPLAEFSYSNHAEFISAGYLVRIELEALSDAETHLDIEVAKDYIIIDGVDNEIAILPINRFLRVWYKGYLLKFIIEKLS
jgi:hypothetical protein